MNGFLVRKTVHMLSALALLWVGYMLGWKAVVLACVVLFFVFTVAHTTQVLPHLIRTPGMVFGEFFFLLGVGLSAYVFLQHDFDPFLAAVLVLAFADPLAALVGKKWGTHELYVFKERRTLEGSAVCFLVSAAVLVPLVPAVNGLGGALVLAFIEALSPRGSDNLFLPLVAGALVVL